MKTPFTTEQFFSVFEKYNHTVFPAQVILILLGVFALIAVGSGLKHKDKFISSILGFLWLWIGIVYHISFFSAINKVAYGFGGLFIIQGFMILFEGVLRDNLRFDFKRTFQGYLGYFFVLHGLVIYPIVGYLIEQNLTHTISLGLPCPTTIMTFGFLLLTDKWFSKYLLIIPSLWAIIGISAVINLGVYQDSMMLIAAVITNVILINSKK